MRKNRKVAYPGGVGTFGGALNFSAQSKVGDFADELSVDEHIAGGQVSVDVVDFRQVLHAESDAAEHRQELKHLELAIVGLG